MRGTGSNDFIVHDIFVPAARAFSLNGPACERGPLYNSRLQLTAVWAATVANALGIARGAIDSFIELAAETSSTSSSSVLRDRPLVQTRVAEAEAILGAARAYVVDSVGSAWAAICDGALDPSHAIAQRVSPSSTACMRPFVRSISYSMRRGQTRSTVRIHWSGISGISMSPFNTAPRFRRNMNPPAKL